MDTFVHSGVIDFSSFDRHVEFFRIEGDYALHHGARDADAERRRPAGRPRRRTRCQTTLHQYLEKGWRDVAAWRLHIRHANVIEPVVRRTAN